MFDSVDGVLSYFFKSLLGSLVCVLPIFGLLFLVDTWQVAKLFSIDIALLCGISYALYDADSRSSESTNDSKTALICFAVGIIAVLGHASLVVSQQRQISAQQAAYQSAQSKSTGSNDSFCYGIGERYGRAAARGMDGRDVKPADDVVIPERCRNLEATSLGIRAGIRMESQR